MALFISSSEVNSTTPSPGLLRWVSAKQTSPAVFINSFNSSHFARVERFSTRTRNSDRVGGPICLVRAVKPPAAVYPPTPFLASLALSTKMLCPRNIVLFSASTALSASLASFKTTYAKPSLKSTSRTLPNVLTSPSRSFSAQVVGKRPQ